jgi:hypothetical protein
MATGVTRNGLKVVTAALISAGIAQLLASTTLGSNEAYRLGYSYGETLRSTDEDEEVMDLKDLDYTLGELEDQFGTASEVGKLFEGEDFTEGVTNGYYKPEITG